VDTEQHHLAITLALREHRRSAITRFRFTLPAIALIFALVCLSIGRSQMERAMHNPARRSSGGPSEPVPDITARAKYVSYAVNVPAWAAQECIPWELHVWRADHTDSDLWYFLFVCVMWYCIGWKLDNWSGQVTSSRASGSKWLSRLVGAVLAAYGLFVCTLALFGAEPARIYERWFYWSIRLWGLTLIVVGLFFLVRRHSTVESHNP
jgi:hypothetical protein